MNLVYFRKRLASIFFTTLLPISILFVSFQVEAGGLTGSIERAIGKKVGQRAAARALQKKAAGASLSVAEKTALKRELAKLDRRTLEIIERRYGMYIRPERLRRSRQTGTWYFHEKPKDGIMGYTKDKPYVYVKDIKVPSTVAHERLHHLSSPRFREQVGKNMDEGVTEFLTQQMRRDIPIKNSAPIYQDQQRVINMLAARIGEKPMAKAYFQGDITPLRKSLDSQLGKGEFDNVIRSVQVSDFKGAEWILKGRPFWR